MKMKWNLSSLLVLSVVEWCMSSRVLVVFPVLRRSNSILGDAIVKTLLEAGHEVTYVTPFPRESREPLQRLKILDVSSTLPGYDSSQAKLSSLLEATPPVHDALHQGPFFAQKVLQHKAVQELLDDATEDFDLVLVDWYFSGLLAPIASLYSCPLIWYSSLDLSWQQLSLMHEASSSVYSTDLNFHHLPPRPYSMWDRVKNTWMQHYLSAWGYYITKYTEIPAYHNIYERAFAIRGRALPDYETSVYNASLMVVNSYPPLGQGLSMTGNIRLVGGHHIELPIPQLPQKLKSLLDKAEKGIILFNLGPDYPSKDLPNDLKRTLLQLFEQLEQTVIWQLDHLPDFRPKNLIVLKTIPHLSILNHPNIKMLITAGDALSVMEATYTGVPVVGLPLLGDQFFNIDSMVERGCGTRVDATGHVIQQLYDAITEIAGNSSYQDNAKIASAIFRHRQPPTQVELQHWVQLVISTRGAPHLRSPALDLPTIERYNLDIVALFLMLLWFLSKVIKVLKAHLTEDDDADKKNE